MCTSVERGRYESDDAETGAESDDLETDDAVTDDDDDEGVDGMAEVVEGTSDGVAGEVVEGASVGLVDEGVEGTDGVFSIAKRKF